MSTVILRRAQLDEKIKQQIRDRVKKLLQQKQEGDQSEPSDSADEQTEDNEGTVYLFDASSHPPREGRRFKGMAGWVAADEWEMTPKELEKYKQEHEMDPSTKVKIIKPKEKGKTKKVEEERGTPPVKNPDHREEKKPESKGEKVPGKKKPAEPLDHSHPSRVPEGSSRQVAIKDRLIDEFGSEAKDWDVHRLDPKQMSKGMTIRFPDGTEKKYGELSSEEKTRVDKAISDGLTASKGLCDYTTVSPSAFHHNMSVNLGLYDNPDVQEEKNEEEEPATKENVGKLSSSLRENGRTLVRKYSRALTSDSRPMAELFVDDMSGAVSEAVRDGSLSGIKQSDLDEFVRESVKRLLHQEVETRRRSLGDHGVRHVVGNVRSSITMLDDLNSHGVKITGKQKLMAIAVMADHDMGYTVGDVATDITKGKKHKEYSKELSDQEKERFDKIFGEEDGKKARDIIATHDDPVFDWEGDPVASTVRLADNTSLFGEDKVQDLFLRSPKATELACKLLLAASAKPDDKKLQEDIKKQMHEVIDGGEFEDADRDALHGQVDEMTEGKFSTTTDILSRFSGKLQGFKFDADKKMMNVNMRYSSEGQMVDQLFGDEVACKQFDKFAKDLGGTPVRGKRGNTIFKSANGKPAFQLNIDGFGEEDDPHTAAMRDFRSKTARSELRRASMTMYPPPPASDKDINRAQKVMEEAKDKFTEEEWEKLMEAFKEGKEDPVALAKKLGGWPLLQAELAFLTGKTATDRMVRRLMISALADRIAGDILADTTLQESVEVDREYNDGNRVAWACNPVTDPEIMKELERDGFKKYRGCYVKIVNRSEEKQPDFDEEVRAEQDPNTGKLYFTSRWANRPGGPRYRVMDQYIPDHLKRFAARGHQTQRKDKDLMRDTGGVSKNRQREPLFKPSRTDSANRYRTKDKTPDQRDPDVDKKEAAERVNRGDVVFVFGRKMVVLDVTHGRTGLDVFVKDDDGKTHWVMRSQCKRTPVEIKASRNSMIVARTQLSSSPRTLREAVGRG